MLKPRRLVIHHTQGWAGNTPAEVRAILDRRKLKGYHWVQFMEATGWRMAMLYRGDMPGAHAAKHNSEAVGYAFIGDFSVSPPGQDRLDAAAIDCAVLLRLYGLTPADMIAHRDVPDNSTDCPGNAFTPTLFENFCTLVAEKYEVAS